MQISLREAKKQADRLTSRLKTLGIEIKRTQALEGIAAVHNFSDWNRFQANLESTAPPSVSIAGSGGDLVVDRGPHRVLMLRPGEGKTSILTLLFADAIRAKAQIPIWIDCNDGYPQHSLPPFVLDHTTVITANFDENGNIQNLAPPSDGCRAIWISLHNPKIPSFPSGRTQEESGRTIRTKAFINLLARIRTNWPSEITRNIGWALFDEFAALDEEHNDLFSTSLPDFAGDNATIVIATQFMKELSRAAQSPLRCRIVSSKVSANIARSIEDLITADANYTLPPSLDSSETLVESFAKMVLVGLQGHRAADIGYSLAQSDRAQMVEKIIWHWKESRRRASAPNG
jgi:hypothetical protein